MIINLSPVGWNVGLPKVAYSKDALTINGELFDFGPVPEGAVLPPGSVGSDWFHGEVKRVDGEIQLTLRLPHGPNPSEAVSFPESIRVTRAGSVKLPFDPPSEEPEAPAVPDQEDEE